jgi:F-type H+-transporting ATPase subunit b
MTKPTGFRIALVTGWLATMVWVAPAIALDSAPHGEAKGGHGPAKYKVHIHTEKGEEEKKFDMADLKQAEELKHALEHGHVHELALDKPPDFLSLKWDLGLWSVVVFLGLFYVLSRYAWPQILSGLQQREAHIATAFHEAEKARKDARELQEKFDRQMATAATQAREVVEEARRDALRLTEDMFAKAKAEIQADRDRLRRELETAKDQALQELWRRTTELSTAIASKALRRQITLEDHQRLFDEALAELEQAGDRRMKEVNQFLA